MFTVLLKKKIFNCLLPIGCCLILFSCSSIETYEKTVAIPGHKWAGSYKPEFSFTVKDTTISYNIFFVIRHTEKYNYNNIFINVYIKGPGADSVITIQKDVTLATNERGWLGTGMNDIYEQRIKLSPENEGTYFPKPGPYTFSLVQIMREQPLEHVMNVGIRIEKKQ